MKHTFIYNGESWFLVVSTYEELIDYFKVVWQEKVENARLDYEKHLKTNVHITNYLAHLFYMKIKFNIYNDNPNIKFEEVCEEYRFDMAKEWYDAISKGEKIFVNINGGYNYEQKNKNTEYKNDYLYPTHTYTEKDIKIKKWVGGVHYYAFVGNLEVKIGDKRKWNTSEVANEAAKNFLNELLLNKKE